MKKLIALSVCLLAANLPDLKAQTFFYKETTTTPEQKVSRVDLDFGVGENFSIEFKDASKLSRFMNSKKELISGVISPRPVSQAEKAIQAGLWILTGFGIFETESAYELGADLKLLSMRGLFFFIFPFESHFLYRHCGNEDYLVAVSPTPTSESVTRMKSLEEVHKLCDSEDDEKSRSDPEDIDS